MRKVTLLVGVVVASGACSPAPVTQCGPGTALVDGVCLIQRVDEPDSGVSLSPHDGGSDSDGGQSIDAGQGFDGGHRPDTDGGVAHIIDWAEQRGTPVSMRRVGTFAGNLFGVAPERVLLSSGSSCTFSLVNKSQCTFRWLDFSGSETKTISNALITYVDGWLSGDGLSMAVIADASPQCIDTSGTPLFRGTHALVGLDDGAMLASTPSLDFATAAGRGFTGLGGWYQQPPAVSTCGGSTQAPQIRKASPPYTATGSTLNSLRSVVELPSGKWFASDYARVGTVDPAGSGALEALDAGTLINIIVGGVNAEYAHVAFKAEASSTTWHTLTEQLSDGGWSTWPSPYPSRRAEGSGRWVWACDAGADRMVRCSVHDVAGEVADAELTVRRGSLLVMAAEHFAAYLDANGALVRRELLTGHEAVLVSGPFAQLAKTADERVALARTESGVVWVIERDSTVMVAEEAQAVWVTPTDRQPSHLGYEGLALIITNNAQGRRGLIAFDAARRLKVVLSDDLYFVAPSQEWYFTKNCSIPRLAHVAGPLYFSERATQLIFAEVASSAPGDVHVFSVPVEFDNPPRLIASLPANQCTPPYVSRDGRRVAIGVSDGGSDSEIWVGDL